MTATKCSHCLQITIHNFWFSLVRFLKPDFICFALAFAKSVPIFNFDGYLNAPSIGTPKWQHQIFFLVACLHFLHSSICFGVKVGIVFWSQVTCRGSPHYRNHHIPLPFLKHCRKLSSYYNRCFQEYYYKKADNSLLLLLQNIILYHNNLGHQ